MRNTLVHRLAAIDPVPQQIIERPATEGPASDRPSGFGNTVLAANAQPIKLGSQCPDAAKFQVQVEDQFDGLGLSRVDHETPDDDDVPERHVAAHPHTLAAGGRQLVADALACDLPLE